MMAKPFLIVGLPRSRTAWLAAVANLDHRVTCYHEPFLEAKTWRDSLAVWASTKYEYVGISDSGLGFHLAEIMAEYKPRVLVIDRPTHEVERSIDDIGFAQVPRFCRLLLERIAPFRCNPLIRVVPFHGLSRPDVVRASLWHLMPGIQFDLDKVALFQNLNVQSDMRRVRKIIAERAADLPAMMGMDVIAALQQPEACV